MPRALGVQFGMRAANGTAEYNKSFLGITMQSEESNLTQPTPELLGLTINARMGGFPPRKARGWGDCSVSGWITERLSK